jgi:hypothetical protein
MRLIFIFAASMALFGGAALADDVTIIHRDATPAPAPGVIIEHRAADVPTDMTREKTITHDADGCTTKTIKRTDGEGDSMTKSKSNC